jgi:hypothetical protein
MWITLRADIRGRPHLAQEKSLPSATATAPHVFDDREEGR